MCNANLIAIGISMKFDEFLFSLPRPYKRLVSVLFDMVFITVAFWFSFFIRHGDLHHMNIADVWYVYASVLVTTILLFAQFGLYRAILRYLTVHSLVIICVTIFLSSCIFFVLGQYSNTVVARSVPVIYGELLLILSGGSRLVMRTLIFNIGRGRTHGKRVVIYGAGCTGRQLCNTLRQTLEYRPIAFVDCNPSLRHINMLGLPIYGIDEVEKLVKKRRIDQVLLALPRASRTERQQVLEKLAALAVEVRTVPDLDDIVSGRAKIDELREVPIEDLLGRDAVAPQTDLLVANITNKVVMVTGAGGSIGSELCRQIIKLKPAKLLLFEVSEYSLYAIDKELSELIADENLAVEVFPLLGSVQREHRLQAVMEAFNVQTLYHAAAYKHVPMVEFNVVEGVRNNVFGTLYTAQAAINAGVETFVLISTDKAVRPTNVMGATKRMAELCLQALACTASNTRFCMVRFGNVLGSSGSVIPLFKHQIATGGPVTVTDPNIIRYFMTIPEAAQLVIQAGAMGKGGDVFVLDMGEPVNITELAKNLIRLSGLEVKNNDNPDGDIEIKFTGLRPGEKLYEELLIGDNVSKTLHERIMTADESYLTWLELLPLLTQLDAACSEFDHEIVRAVLLDAPTGFTPTDGICDLVWNVKQHNGLDVA